MHLTIRSLRSKIFLAAIGLLLLVAGAVMPVTKHDVTQTVEAGERNAVDNVIKLALGGTEARWASLLDDKIRSVRIGRTQLLEVGTTVKSMLASYADMAQRGIMTEAAAKALAQEWINRLRLGDGRYAFIYDASHMVLASGAQDMLGTDLSSVRDIKSRPLAQAVYDEVKLSGTAFALYRWSLDGSSEKQGDKERTHYAYFGYFEPWDWVLAVSDDASDILNQIREQRVQMEFATRESLASLTLARSGFLLIEADDGRSILAPPDAHKGLLNAVDKASGLSLKTLLQNRQPGMRSYTVYSDGQPWLIQTERHKPLGWTIAAAVPQSDLSAPAAQLIRRQALIFGGALVLTLALVWLVATRITRPLDILSRYARSLPERDLSAPPPAHVAQLPDLHRDEVGRLAQSFFLMQQKLSENVKRLMEETSARERFESELNIARDIQLGLLPLPLSSDVTARVALYAATQPAKEVGGDLYDYFTLPNGRLCFAIGDVSDKGVPAALFMAVTRTLIRATAEDESDPALIMQRVNNRLSENNPNMMFVTMLLGVLDLDTGELIWANAGHPPPALIAQDGSVCLLRGRSGPACGVQEDIEYVRLKAQLSLGEIFVGYTDGVTDAVDVHGAQYGEPRMLACLERTGSDGAKASVETLLEDVARFSNNANPYDDITLISIQRS